MLLKNAYIVGAEQEESQSIAIKGAYIRQTSSASALHLGQSLDLQGALVFPGLINSHDHLTLNLYPLIKSRLYKNYREWAADVQNNYQTTIRQIEKIPKELRFLYGAYKNLINGATSLVQHGSCYTTPYPPLIDVDCSTYPLHSLAFEKKWALKLWRKMDKPLVLHLGEGIGHVAASEIRRFFRWNWSQRKIIAVHGLALQPAQAARLQALIWCPESNLQLYGQTAAVDQLKARVPILFGSDSTLSASWNLWEHLRNARRLGMLSDRELFQSLTSSPANIWRYRQKGKIQPGRLADLVVAKKKRAPIWEAFYAISPEDILLVVKNGKVVLCDDVWLPKILKTELATDYYWTINVSGGKKHIAANLPALLKQIQEYCPTSGVQYLASSI